MLLIGVGVLAASYHAAVKRQLTDAVLTRRLDLARLAAATLSERLDRVSDLAGSLATRVRFSELAAAGRWDPAMAILEGVPAQFSHIERVGLADPRGTLMSDAPPAAKVRGVNFADRDWYRGVSRNWTTHVSSVYRRTAAPQRNVIAVATPVRHGGKVVGILVLQLSLEAFFDWAGELDLSQSLTLAVADAQGQAGFNSRRALHGPIADLSAHPVVRRLLAGNGGTELGADASGVDKVYAFAPAKHGWGVLIEQPAAVAFAARDAQLRLIQLAYVLVALLLAAVAGLALRVGRERLAELGRARRALASHAERLRILHEIDRAIAAQERPEAIAAAVIRPLRELLDVPRAVVNRLDLAAGEVEWIAAAGRRRMHVGPGVRYPIGLMGDLAGLRRGEPQRIDVDAMPRGAEREALLASGVHAYMVVPMIAGGELIGALSFGADAKQFPARQIAIAQETATQLAIAIAQARLHERVRRHAAELERRVAERTADLEAAKGELEDLYHNAPCGYHSVDADGLIVRMNDTWLAWLGYAREEVVGRMRHPDLMTPESAERFRTEAFPRFLSQGWLKETEFEYRRKDGSVFHASLNATSIRDPRGRLLMSRSTVFDISARKRAEDTVRALNKELEAFSYSVSHDLRAPLRAIDGYARMLEEDYGPKLDAEGLRLLGVVRASSRQMGQLIDDLLDFSRLGRQSLARRPVDMTALVREVITVLTHTAPGARVELATLPEADCDPALLRQAWANLIGNALKYSGTRAEPRVEVGGRAEALGNVYWVRDNGVGFDMRYVEKLFGVFQRLHSVEEFPGTGVGLAIVQRVIARHGGRVWAEGRPGAGASFFFWLPRQA